MSYQVYSLLTTHRSHRIERLRIKDSVGTGKPHACNLCHLDKSLGWTQDHLVQWYGHKSEPLSDEERTVASALLYLCRADARSRVVAAGAFSWPPALAASGTSWAGLFLPHLLERERYPAVRYLAYRGLQAQHGPGVAPFDYLAEPEVRRAQLGRLAEQWRARHRPAAERFPYLPLRPDGRMDAEKIAALLAKREDPDVFIHE